MIRIESRGLLALILALLLVSPAAGLQQDIRQQIESVERQLDAVRKAEKPDTKRWKALQDKLRELYRQQEQAEKAQTALSAGVAQAEGQPAGSEKLKAQPAPQPKFIMGSPAPVTAEVKEMVVSLPACTSSLARIIPAIEAVKKEMAGNGQLAAFMQRLNDAGSCQEVVKVLEEASPGIISRTSADPSIKVTPDQVEFITDRRDPALAEYGISFDVQFTNWAENRVAGKELWTLDDFRASREVIKDHVKYMSVANPTSQVQSEKLEAVRRKSNGVFDRLQANAPKLLDGCLDEAWRWKVGLCSIRDAADIPVWVETWAKQAWLGLYYNLASARRAPALVAFDEDTGQTLAFGGPCGGNGIWVATKVRAVFLTEVIGNYIVCASIKADRPVGASGLVLKPGESVTLSVVEEATGSRTGSRQENFLWRINGQELAGAAVGAKQVVVSYDQLAQANSEVTVESEMLDPANPKSKSLKVCRINISRFQPPPQPLCESASAAVVKDLVKVTVKFVDPGQMLSGLRVLVGSSLAAAVPVPSQELVADSKGVLSFPLALVPYGEQYVFVQGLDSSGKEVPGAICQDKTDRNLIRRPCPQCLSPNKTFKVDKNNGLTLSISDFFPGINIREDSVRLTLAGRTETAASLTLTMSDFDKPGKFAGRVEAQLEGTDECKLVCNFFLEVPGGGKGKLITGLVAVAAGGAVAAAVLGKGQAGKPASPAAGSGVGPGSAPPSGVIVGGNR